VRGADGPAPRIWLGVCPLRLEGFASSLELSILLPLPEIELLTTPAANGPDHGAEHRFESF